MLNNNDNNAAIKADLRRSLLSARRAIAPDLRAEWDAQIAARLRSWFATSPAATLGVYWPIMGEPDLRETYAELAGQGVALVLPVVQGPAAPLAFVEWLPGEALTKDLSGVPVPQTQRIAAMPSAVLVPCVGFNGERFRLGYGAGFYDRTLAQAARPFTIGVAYACASAAFDNDPHDVALNVIITETLTLPPGSQPA